MKAMVFLCLISFAYFPPNVNAKPAVRCFVGPKSVKTALKKSTAVFSGEVLELRRGGNFIEARFRVEHSWKGVKAGEVSVLEPESTAESPHYQVGEKYLVFAGSQNGELFTGNCSR